MKVLLLAYSKCFIFLPLGLMVEKGRLMGLWEISASASVLVITLLVLAAIPPPRTPGDPGGCAGTETGVRASTETDRGPCLRGDTPPLTRKAAGSA